MLLTWLVQKRNMVPVLATKVLKQKVASVVRGAY